jgi:positive regulator of sigma E activity
MPPSLLGYLENWFYWVELLVILDLAWILNLKSRDILYPVIGLMLAGALFNILGVNELAEVILRISFVGLIVGVIFTLVENYKEPLRRKK